MKPIRVCLVLWSLTASGSTQLTAQQRPETPTRDDYARAESFLAPNTSRLVFRATVRLEWLADDRLWYRNTIPDGTEFVLVNATVGVRERAFDHERVAQALSEAADTSISAFAIPVDALELGEDGGLVALTTDVGDGGERYRCDVDSFACNAAAPPPPTAPHAIASPDGTGAAFIRDHNLWLRDLESGAERPLTKDGVQDYGYATNNAGWIRRESPVLLWSPDSRMIATFRHDGRGVGMMHMATTGIGRPQLRSWRYPLPGDSVIFRIERVVIHVDEAPDGSQRDADGGARVTRLQMPPDPHRSSVTDHVAGQGGVFLDVEWSPDGARLAFVSSSRDHKVATLRIADPQTGEVRDVLTEREKTFFESGPGTPNWRVLHRSREVLWYSKRDNWGHLYRYDLDSGELLGRVTDGDWNVHRVLHVDEAGRTVYFVGNGREPGDPYFRHLYRVGIDGTGLRLLTPDSADHAVTLSPSGEHFVDSYSTPVSPPVTVLREMEGNVVVELERADISQLIAIGWRPPEPFVVKARDGETDLHGLMYRPTGFDASRSYPVVNYLYPGPQSGSVRTRSFRAARRDKQALAELGFVVVEVDAMGTPWRSKEFHDAYYGNMGDNGLPDQVAMIRQLGARHPWMDLGRVGIWGHSGGGFASAAGILRYPDLYKVAVSQAGNHDNRNYADDWGEKWQGLMKRHADGTTNYDNQANQLLADRLEGKLLLAHGTIDTNVPVYNTLLMVDALIAADKDFDLIVLPNRGHGFSGDAYMTRRRWDYFVRHLLGGEPPESGS